LLLGNISAAAVAASVGQVTPAQTAHASRLDASIPNELRDAAREPFSARALVYCLLLDPVEEVRRGQLAKLQAGADPRDFAETNRLAAHLTDLPDAARLPLVDLAVPALRRMSPAQHQVFRQQVEQLIWADRRLSIFEYAVRCVLHRYLDAHFGKPPLRQRPPAGALTDRVVVVLSLLAWEGQDDESAARAAFEAGMRQFQPEGPAPTIISRTECNLDRFDHALQELSGAPADVKKRLLLACAACIDADGKTTVREAELYRAISLVVGVPVPPLTGE
jgi:hypothetical protein